MNTDWVTSTFTQMSHGLVVTLQLAGIAVGLSVVLGLIVGTIGVIPLRPIQFLVKLYIEVWRGLPIVVTLFFMFFALPAFRIALSPLVAASIGLTLWGSANLAALVRGAIETIPLSQHEGSAALGMNWLMRMRYVILPQGFRRLLPPSLGIIAILIQATTAASLIGVDEVLFEGRVNIERLTLTVGQTHAVPILGTVLVLFFIVSFSMGRLARWLEGKLRY